MRDLYEKLRERLDDLATGYPATKIGAEIRILKRLFTDVEAEFFLQLSPSPKTPEEVAKRLSQNPDQIASLMDKMAKKGLLFRHQKGGMVRYAAVPYVVGIFEFQINRLDRELALDMDEYHEIALIRTIQSFKTPVMRTIPINREFVVKLPIAPYEDVLEILNSKKKDCNCPLYLSNRDEPGRQKL